MDNSIYFDINETLSYNALFNFITGGRGVGKTFGAKKRVIDDFIKYEHEFVYLRRYKTELKKFNKFFDDIREYYPNDKLVIKDNCAYINDKLAGYGLQLSTGKINKSVPYPRVKTIIFDEFIIDKGVYHYLQDEVTNFLDMYSTIARLRDVRVLFLSNNITFTNPYYLYFNLTEPKNKKGISCKNDILIQFVKADKYIERAKETRFGKIIAGTEYADYAIENKSLRDSDTFICEQPQDIHYYFTIKSEGELFGVWVSREEGIMYVSHKVDTSCKLIYVTKLENHKPNTMLLKGANKSILFESFVKNFKIGLVYFDSIKTKNVVLETIKNTL